MLVFTDDRDDVVGEDADRPAVLLPKYDRRRSDAELPTAKHVLRGRRDQGDAGPTPNQIPRARFLRRCEQALRGVTEAALIAIRHDVLLVDDRKDRARDDVHPSVIENGITGSISLRIARRPRWRPCRSRRCSERER